MSSNAIGSGVLRYARWPLIRYGLMIAGIAAASLFMWPGLLRNLLSESSMPHGYCLLWDPKLLWLHITSDSAIGLSYVAISLTLAWLVHRARNDIPFHWVFLAFGLFIIACGSTHFMEVVTVWHPLYWLSGDVKLITAIASVATAIVLPPLVPQTLTMIQAAKMSEQRRLRIEAQNRELEEMTRKLKELDELKTRFFANVSHELRTPLALTLGRTEKLLASGALQPGQRRELEVVHRNARALLKQVNDLLDISKLEAGRMGLSYSEIDFACLVRRTVANFESLASDRQLKFSYTGPDTLAAQVDSEKVERILLNLLSNAFKFTPDGGAITCDVRSDGGEVELVVGDSGPGIPPEMRDAVFDRFRQIEPNSTRRFGGTGLGLAIVKDMVALHHGSIHVGQAREGGAEFSVRLPVRAPENAVVGSASPTTMTETVDDEAEEAVRELQPVKVALPTDAGDIERSIASAPLVLVVEDNPEMNRFMVESLAGEYRVISALDGAEGLRKALSLHPDLILSDVMMPQLSGEDLLRDLRSRPEFEATPVVLLTAKADQRHRVNVLRMGAQDYIMKPFSVEEVRLRVRNLTSMSVTRRVLQQELNTHTHDVQQLAHEVSLSRRQLHTALDALRVSESRFRRLVESNLMGVVTLELNGRITEANDAFLNMVGYTREELNRGDLDWQAMTPAENIQGDAEALQQLNRVGVAGPWEKQCIRKDGTRVPVLIGAARLEGSDHAAISFILDLTPRKRAEARVSVQYAAARILSEAMDEHAASAPFLQAIGETLGWDYGEMWTVDSNTGLLNCVETWSATPGSFSKFEALARKAHFDRRQGLPGCVWPTSVPCWMTCIEDQPEFIRASLASSEGLQSAFGFPILVHDEMLGSVAFFSRKIQEPDPELLQISRGLGNQVGQYLERKRSQAALRESEQRFRTVVEAVPQIVWTARPDGAIDFYNQRWYDYTSLSYEQTKGWGWQSALHPDDLQRCSEQWTHAVETGTLYEIAYRLRRQDGNYRWQLGRAVPLRGVDGTIVKWFGSSTDIDDQKKAEAASAHLAAIVESSDDAIIGKTLDGRITSWNRGAERIFGYKAEETLGRPIWMLSPPERQDEMVEILGRLTAGEAIQHLQTVRLTKDARRIDVLLSVSLVRDKAGQVIGASTIARDVTELKRAEDALRNSEKHATVGRLAATMAHEINNPLEAVSNVLYLLASRPNVDDEGRQYVSIASQEMDRIAHIVRQTLGFYRESATPVLVDIAALVDSVLVLYSRKLHEKRLKLEKRIDEVRPVPAFPAEMRQVFSNLIVNAIEATEQGGSLKLHVFASRDWTHPSRRGVRIMVCDTGAGIAAENRRNLFEPFFTTKGEKGTGLGLWVSNGIVQKHGGLLRVHSSARQGRSGTCFSVFLPSASSAPGPGNDTTPPPPLANPDAR